MKRLKRLVLLLVLLSLLVPTSLVVARTPVQRLLVIRNRTGGDIVIDMVNANDKHNSFVVNPGVYRFYIKEGVYDVYMSTACGNTSGVWNVNLRKTLFTSCRGGLMVLLDKEFLGSRMTKFTGD